MSKGTRIREYRERVHLTQVELALKIGVSKQTLYKYENDIITNIPSDKIEAIAQETGVTPEMIMGWHVSSDIPFSVSSHEEEIVLHYRAADSGTQKSVRKLLDVSDPEESSLHLMPVAAHAKEGASLEELEDDARMVDDD